MIPAGKTGSQSLKMNSCQASRRQREHKAAAWQLLCLRL
jgi:hypothetical protein